MTHLAEHPPSFWMAPDRSSQPLACATDHAVLQSLHAGCAPARGHRGQGLLLRPELHRPLMVDRTRERELECERERERLGLDPHRPTGVVMLGGQGSMAMLTIARQLPDVQLVLLCGHDATLAQRLRSLNPSAPQRVVGRSTDLRHHLALGDFFIGKPGPGSFSEALRMGLPVLTVRNAWTTPQERAHIDWVRTRGLGLVGASWQHMRPLVQLLLESLPAYRAAVRRLESSVVF